MNHFWLALGFLTIVPTRPFAYELDALGQAGKWFPIVGLFVGGVLVGMHFLLMQLFPPLLTAVLVVVLWVVLTGALHLDGVADCGDALWVPVSRARRLEILQDSRVGTFGSVALILFLLMKGFRYLLLGLPRC